MSDAVYNNQLFLDSYKTIKNLIYNDEEIVYPTKLKISTITATSYIGTVINLEKFFTNLNPYIYNIQYIEYNNKFHEINVKGYNKKYENKRRKGLIKKCFDNQVTIVFGVEENNFNINMKIFKNGKIQMTGIKNIDNGHIYVDQLINIIKDIYLIDDSVVEEYEKLNNIDYKIRLINSDFKIGFPVKREKLYNLLIDNYKELICSYEPCIYPGVKISYLYNENKIIKNGICECKSKICFTRKNGSGIEEDACKKITIVVFQSGSVIVTGSNNILQLNECYDFISRILLDHMKDIELNHI
jgi:TATA-box binding protein (TBP) (component of TFIID and TFIIIB)